MSSLEKITPMIITFNEEANIERCLSGLGWAKKILVIDSFSTDRTLEILKKDSRVQILQRKFDDFASQCNFGLKHIETEWVLSLDADYLVTPKWAKEASNSIQDETLYGFKIPLKACIEGKPLISSIFPRRTCLYKKACTHYTMEGHGHRAVVEGETANFSNSILVEDQKSLVLWFNNQIKYAEKEAQMLLSISILKLSFSDKIRRLYVVAPFIVFLYCYFIKLGFLDGLNGLFYSFQRSFFELALSINLLNKRFYIRKSKKFAALKN